MFGYDQGVMSSLLTASNAMMNKVCNSNADHVVLYSLRNLKDNSLLPHPILHLTLCVKTLPNVLVLQLYNRYACKGIFIVITQQTNF